MAEPGQVLENPATGERFVADGEPRVRFELRPARRVEAFLERYVELGQSGQFHEARLSAPAARRRHGARVRG